jgi:hypothetical protein
MGMHKTKMMRETEERLGKPLEEILPETVREKGGLEAAGAALGISPNTIYIWLIKLGFTFKKILIKDER